MTDWGAVLGRAHLDLLAPDEFARLQDQAIADLAVRYRDRSVAARAELDRELAAYPGLVAEVAAVRDERRQVDDEYARATDQLVELRRRVAVTQADGRIVVLPADVQARFRSLEGEVRGLEARSRVLGSKRDQVQYRLDAVLTRCAALRDEIARGADL